MTAAVVDELGPPDVLVNNAGIAVFDDPLELSDADWDRCFDVDLNGVWYCCREALPHLIAAGSASIVNIASVHAFQIIPGCFPYPVAKHGVLGLTRALAMDYAPHGVRVNAISPGYIDTPINAEIWSQTPDPQAERDKAAALHPVGRIGTPDEVAWPAVFLASDESSFVTGANLVVDGGRSVLHHE
jgi:NAD(P)-dependent dehydrogenase (short-subunit alcohol dehydrogenase family)